MTQYQIKCHLFRGICRIFPEIFTIDRNDLVDHLNIQNVSNNYSALWYYIDGKSIPDRSFGETIQWLINSLNQHKHDIQILIDKRNLSR